MQDTFVTVGTFTHETEAYLFRSRLEHEGIECFIADNNITTVHPFLSNAVGGIKVNIRSSDHEKAKVIISEIEEQSNKHQSKKIKVGSTIYNAIEGYCPNCDSEAIYVKNYDLIKLIISVIAAACLLPPPFKKDVICRDCLHKWKKY